MNTLLDTNVTLEQANALIESVGMTCEVKSYELNERGHMYILKDGLRMVITSPTTFSLHLDKHE